MEKEIANWYKDGSGTDFYHSLNRERNPREAELFMKNLTTYLNLSEHSTILDLGCGRGRHTEVLVDMGYRVEPLDICGNHPPAAGSAVAGSGIPGDHDSSSPLAGTYEAVFSLFSSFGFLENESDQLAVLTMMKKGLNASGLGVIDFINISGKQDESDRERETAVGNMRFEQENTSLATERVRALSLGDFERLFEQAGIYLLDIFGDYKLNTYHPSSSERLVMIFK